MTANSASNKTMVVRATNSGSGSATLDIDAGDSYTIDAGGASYVSTIAGSLTLYCATGINLDGKAS